MYMRLDIKHLSYDHEVKSDKRMKKIHKGQREHYKN